MKPKILTSANKWRQLVSLIFSVLIGAIPLGAKALSSSVFAEMAEMTGGSVVTLPKPKEGEDDLTIQCTAFNIIMGTLRPTITAITPMKLPLGSTTNLLITAPNANFNSSSTVQIKESNITINDDSLVVLSPTKIQINVTVPDSAALKFYDVLAETTLGDKVESAEGRCALEVVEKTSSTQILSISPNKISQGSTVDMDIYGNNTDFSVAPPSLDMGTGVTANVKEVLNPTHLIATVDVAQTADSGFRKVIVTTSGIDARDVQPSGALLVTSIPTIPLLTSITPNQGQQGKTIEDVNIQGANTHFTSSSTVSFSGAGVTASSINVKNATQIIATVEIAIDAPFGSQDVFVATGDETATLLKGFEIRLNSAPTEISLSNTTINDDSDNDTVVGTFSTEDSDDTAHTYTLESDAEGRFKIDNDQLLVANSASLRTNYQKSQIKVKSTDIGGKSKTQAIDININYTPIDIELSQNIVIIGSGIGSEIGALSTTDPNFNDTHSYSVIENAEGRFDLVENNLVVANSSLLENGDYEIKIRTTDNTGLYFDKSFTINVTDIDIALSNTIVLLDTLPGTIGELSTIDQTPNDTHTYTLEKNVQTEDGKDIFSIEGDKLKSSQKFSELAQHEITIRTTDSTGLPYDENFTITVKNLSLSKNTVLINSEVETEIGQLITTIPFSSKQHSYALKDDKGGLFKIAGTRLLVANQELLTKGDYEITVRSTETDNKKLSFEKDFTVKVVETEEPIVDIPPTDIKNPPEEDTSDDGKDTPDDKPPNNEQANVASLILGNAQNNVSLIAQDTDCHFDNAKATTEDEQPVLDDKHDFPHGLISFELSCADTELTLYYHGVTDSTGWLYRQYDGISQKWQDLPEAIFEQTEIDGKIATLVTLPLNNNGSDENDKLIHLGGVATQSTVTTTPLSTVKIDSKIPLMVNEYGNTTTTLSSLGEVSGQKVSIIVTRGASTEGTITVDYELTTHNATPGTDYVHISPQQGTLTWGAGDQTTKHIQLFVVDDDYKEEDETLVFKLFNPVGAEIAMPSEAQIVIKDEESNPPKDKPNQPEDEESNPPKEESEIVIEDKICNAERALQSSETEIFLRLDDDEPYTLTFSGGQDINAEDQRQLIKAPDTEIVSMESLIFPREEGAILTLVPVAEGETHLIIGDCAGEKRVNIIVEKGCDHNPDLALQAEQQEITFVIGDEPFMLPFTGGQETIELISPQDNEVAKGTLFFTEDSEKFLQLTPQQVGETTFSVKDCASETQVNVVVVPSQCDIITPNVDLALNAEEEEILLVAGDKPTLVKITGGQGELELTKSRNQEAVAGSLLSSDAGDTLLMLTPDEKGQTTFIINDCVSQATVNITVLPEPPNTLGVNTKGEFVETTAYFEIKLSTVSGKSGDDFWVGPIDSITMGLNLIIDKAHVGQAASLILLLEHQLNGQQFMRDESDWHTWDGQLSKLVAAKTYSRLPNTIKATQLLGTLNELSLESFEGEMTVNVGYRLGDGTIIFNGENPPSFKIANGIGLDAVEKEVKTSAHFEGVLNTESGQTGNHLIIGRTDALTAHFTIQVDEKHVGESASLAIAAIHQVSGQFFMHDGNAWQPWYGDFGGLVMAESYDTLPQQIENEPLILNTLPLDTLAGEWALYIGYRLEEAADLENERAVIFNGLSPLRFWIANGVGLSLQTYEEVKTATHIQTQLNTESGLQGNGLEISQTDEVAIEFHLNIDPADVGQAARLILIARQIDADGEEKALFIYNGITWQTWDDDLTRLKSAAIYDELPAVLTETKPLALETLPLDTLPAELLVYLGYHLGNEEFIYNSNNPLHFRLIEGQQPTKPEDKKPCLFCD
ncbi:Calx-beta domain-containing protein [Candidatus Parabeggiatoa sp. HSG14]|uniref:Calx-beta domain-containing protein n=1 Tax=Candidatus Parabeggiatoa sp. HSG14 TaxID=3055593 RepID=UPI0025A6AF38|nr:Calx-beta domain-containing protein [Thiotrichales bacterium HSG14]